LAEAGEKFENWNYSVDPGRAEWKLWKQRRGQSDGRVGSWYIIPLSYALSPRITLQPAKRPNQWPFNH